MRLRPRLLAALLALALLPGGAAVASPVDEKLDVLVFTETTGFRHDSIIDGIKYFNRLAADTGLEGVDVDVELAENSTGWFTDDTLKRFDVVVFLSTTGNPLNTTEQGAFERFIQRGGGYLGVHAAADSEYSWPWYGDLVGGYFSSHPAGTPQATINVEDGDHASTAHLPSRWTRSDEWYNYRRNPRKQVCNTAPEVAGVETQSVLEPMPGLPFPLSLAQPSDTGIPEEYDTREQDCTVHVLLSLDESTYNNNNPMGDHPIAWCHNFDGGRGFYTGLGHTSASYSDPAFSKHLLGGLLTAAGLADCPGPEQP